MQRKLYKRRGREDRISLRGHFFTRKKSEWDQHRFLLQYGRGLLADYHMTDDFTGFILSLIPEPELFPLVADIALLLADDIADNDDLRDELDVTVARKERPMLPAMRDIEELFLYIDGSGQRQKILDRIGEALGRRDESRHELELIPSYARLAHVFHLESDDLKILSFLYAVYTCEPLDTLVSDWAVNEFFQGMSLATGVPQEKCQGRFSPRSPLVTRSLVGTARRHEGVYCITDSLASYLSFAGQKNLHESLLEEDTGKAYEIESFCVDELRRSTVLDLLKGNVPSHILLYGKEGSGKTEFAKSLAEAAGKRLFKYHQGDSEKRDGEDLFNLSLVTASTDNRDSVIVVDEADSLLSTAPSSFFGVFGSSKSSKARINDIFDNSQCSVIWIANRVRQIDSSTCRRFSFSVEFGPLPPLSIRRLAREYITGLELSDTLREAIISMTGNYGLTAASLRYLRDTLESIAGSGESDERIRARIRTLFESNVRLVTGSVPLRTETGSAYTLDALNVSVHPTRLLSSVRRALERSESKGLRYLFHGESGTGKTELARFIAGELGKPLLIKRASDILSPWVGVAEKNVSALFKEAEDSRSILLIDEADSFFYDREKATRSWERSLVNEFLTRMEEFSGILICITNLPSVLDKAVSRRFHETVEFHPLTMDGIPLLLSRYYPAMTFTDEQIFDLYTQGTLTPGDFGSLKGRTDYMDESEVTSAYVIQSLREIIRARRVAGEEA
jgi:AAA+ superfamily predicted ATPase